MKKFILTVIAASTFFATCSIGENAIAGNRKAKKVSFDVVLENELASNAIGLRVA